ncbi:hypothetical protein V6N11_048711 [Hibiscus sabdariffa]|uniref:MORF/ORRM1/DAG-like MORF domain-containing protein n=1 Tax=Hibiscus sabdariffa TaxID=183260 RepID=A0ABR2PW37_9ROSI
MEPLSSVVQKLIGRRFSTHPSFSRCILSRYISSNSGYNNSVLPERVELTRTPVLVAGCDYEHWFVVMEAPKGYPLRDEIVNTYIKTLAMALGSEEEAKKSMYSVSTKYYYAFGCKVPEDLAFKIKSLPYVKWVLPDSYLDGHGDGSYGELVGVGVAIKEVGGILETLKHGSLTSALECPFHELNGVRFVCLVNLDRYVSLGEPNEKKQSAPDSDVALDHLVDGASDENHSLMGMLFLMMTSITPTGFRLETKMKVMEQLIQKKEVKNKGNSSIIAGMPPLLLHFSFVWYEFSKLTQCSRRTE